MQQAEQALRLLIVESQLEQAEFLISHIRNGGTIVRPERAEDIEDVAQFLENNQVDLVILNQIKILFYPTFCTRR